MQLKIMDGLGIAQTLVSKGLEAPMDRSGSITATGVSQTLLAPNLARSGWTAQNISGHTLYWNDVGTASSALGSFQVAAGGFFPPTDFPMQTGAVNIMGTIGDQFTVREW